MGILALVYRAGSWNKILNVQDTIINGLAGAMLAFVGSFVISLFRSPKLLDDDRLSDVKHREDSMDELQKRIEALEKDPFDDAFVARVKQLLSQATDEEIELLKFLLHHGEMELRLISFGTCGRDQIRDAAYTCSERGFLDKRDIRPGNGLVVFATYFKIKDHFKPVLQRLLFPRS